MTEQTSDPHDFQDERKIAASFMRRLYEKGLTTSSGGNISIRCGDFVVLSPSGSDKAMTSTDSMGVCDLDGTPADEAFKPSIEAKMHLEIYKARPDVNAIVHAHPVHSSAFAASNAAIRTDFLSESYAILGNVAVAPYHCMGTSELANSVAESLKDSDCAIMRKHGAIAVGRTIFEAFDRMEVLEAAARINLLLLGPLKDSANPLTPSELAEIDAVIGRQTDKGG